MTSSISIQVLPSNNQNYNPNIFPISSKPIYDTINTYQPLNSVYSKNIYHKNTFSTSTVSSLMNQNYTYNFLIPSIPSATIENSNTYDSNTFIYNNKHKKVLTPNHSFNYPIKTNKVFQRYHSSESHNMYNLSNFLGFENQEKNNYTFLDTKTVDGKKHSLSNYISSSNTGKIITKEQNDFSFFQPKIDNIIKHSNTNYIPPIKPYKNRISIIHSQYSTRKYLPKKTITNIYNNNYTNYNTEFYSNKNNSNNYSSNLILNSEIDNITNNITNNYLNNNLNNSDNIYFNSNFSIEEPSNNFKLSDFIVLKKMGEGAEGTINAVRWKKNNKIYILKKCEIIYDDVAKQRKEINMHLKNLVDSTGCNGIIKIYGHLLSTNHFGTYYFYELMEKADKDWEQEIFYRQKHNLYYQEYELMNLFKQLIKTFSLLQLNNFTHRDIKPTNIMIVNGILKICDFGNARIIKNNGVIIQKIRGSELFLSPIIFKGLHSGMTTIRHNTYKSDVFSLGMCFFLAASLGYDGLNIIREIYDMNIIRKVLNQCLGKRYSQNLINLLLNMLQVDENKRPDFIQLEIMFS